MSYNYVIRSEEPNAAKILQENIESIESRQSYMQKVNEYYQIHGSVIGCPGVELDTAAKLNDRVNAEQSAPYPDKFFEDNSKEINRLKSLIERLNTNKESLFKGWQFENGEAVINLANNRLQLMFSKKPDEQQLSMLHKNNFKWAPTAKAWQRPLGFRTMAVCEKIDFIKPKDGRKLSDIQPKAPKRNEPER